MDRELKRNDNPGCRDLGHRLVQPVVLPPRRALPDAGIHVPETGHHPASELPWEFPAQIRPWLHPLLYFLIAKPLILLGVKDMFTIVFILRLATGLFSLAALAVFVRALLPTIEGEEEKRAFVRYLPLFGFLPYLFVRTSSETMSAAFFAIGLALVIGEKIEPAPGPCGTVLRPGVRMPLSNCLYGIGPVCLARDHRAGAVGRAGGISGRRALRHAAGSAGGPLGLRDMGLSPVQLLHANIVQDVAATRFGRRPFFAFLYLTPAQIFSASP